MVNEAVLICIHGYTQKPRTGERTWVEVVNDRLKRALKLAEFFKKAGIINYLVFSGGVLNSNKVEADIIYEHAKKTFPKLFELVNDVILERESKNTQQNVDEIIKWALKKNAAIIAISSKDHAARIMNDWAYNIDAERHLLLVSPSEESYSELGHTKKPIVIEPPFWAYECLEKIFSVPDNKKDTVKKAFEKAISDSLNDSKKQ
jgi:hypothetical protein